MRLTADHKEHGFQDDFMEDLRRHGAHVASFVGNFYMAGQPDLEITSIHGCIMKVELKMYRYTALPTRQHIIGLLKGPQINVILKQLWGRNADCLIIAEIVAKPDTLCIVSKLGLSFDYKENVCKLLAHAPKGLCPYQLNQKA